MDPNNSNYPPGLSPQLDPTLQQPSAPGLMQTGMSGAVFGQHEARLQAADIAAGYAAGAATGALEASLRGAQAFGTASFIFDAAEGYRREAGTLTPGFSRTARASRMLDPFLAAPGAAFNMVTDPRGNHPRGIMKGASSILNARAGFRNTRFLGQAARVARVGLGGMAAIGTGGLYLAAQEAAISTAGAIYEGHENRMQSSSLINAVAPGSMSFSQEQARSSDMGGMAKGMGMEFEEFAGLTQMLGQTGTFNGVASLQEFKGKLRQSLTQLKQIAQVTNSTLQEAGQIGVMLGQQGFSGGQLPAAAAQAFGIGQATGLGAAQVVQMGAIGAQFGAQTNIGQTQGSSMFQQSLGSMEFAMQRGAFSNEMIQRMGGTSSSATLQMMQGTMGQAGMLGTTTSQMMGFIAKKGPNEYSSPTIDKAKLEKLLNGGVSRMELAAVSQTQQVLGMSSPIQREAMPQLGQMLHATLSQGTGSQEEYLRKAEMMGIQPDVALALRETERSRGLMTASARLEARQNELASSAGRSVGTGGMFGFELDLGIARGLNRAGDSISRGFGEAAEAIIPSERKATQATSTSRDIMRRFLQDGGDMTIDPGLLTNAPQRGEGSGNPFFAGEGELRREAMLREFSPIFTSREQEGTVFAESSLSTFRASKSAIDEAVRHRSDVGRNLSEKAIADASFLADSGAFNNPQELVRDELGFGVATAARLGGGMSFNQGHRRDNLQTLAIAKKLNLAPAADIQSMAMEIAKGNHSADTGLKVQKLKNTIHATGQAIGHDFSGNVGSDITGASGAGAMDAKAIQRVGDKAASRIVASARKDAGLVDHLIDLVPFSRLFMEAPKGIGGTGFGTLSTDESRALEGLFSPESRESTLAMVRELKTEMDRTGGDFNLARRQVESAKGLMGAELRAVRNLLTTGDGGAASIRDLEDSAAASAYLQIANPVAGRARSAAFDHFGESSMSRRQRDELGGGGFYGRRGGTTGDNILTALDIAGQRGTSHRDRSAAMETLLRQSFEDESFADERALLKGKAGLEGVTDIFTTIEKLVEGAEIPGFPGKKGGRDLDAAIELAKEKGILDIGIVGDAAQAQARAGDDGRASLGSDLRIFSQTVEGLAGTVRQLQVNAGLITQDGSPGENAASGLNFVEDESAEKPFQMGD